MESVVFDGVEYVKASAVAKKFKYTSDYIGQLCRAKKVDARLVGRTWFVNPESIIDHKETKHGKRTPEKKSPHSEIASKSKPVSIKVEQTLTSKTAKNVAEHSRSSNKITASRLVKISYEQDEESLIPAINTASSTARNQTKSKTVQVEVAKAKKIKITAGAKKPTAFRADPLPDVALSGKLSVSSYEKPNVSPAEEIETPQLSNEPTKKFSRITVKNDPVPVEDVLEEVVSEVKEANQPAAFTPQLIAGRSKSPSRLVLLSPLLATTVAALVALAVFTASSQAIVSSTESSSGITFQAANLLELIQ